jgi:N-ethylmaleimide reductase
MTTLFEPLQMGEVTLNNRIIMAPLTRMRTQAGNVPYALNAEYYAQRAGAGLIISEATQVSQQGQGYPATPGIYSAEQVEGWKQEWHIKECLLLRNCCKNGRKRYKWLMQV